MNKALNISENELTISSSTNNLTVVREFIESFGKEIHLSKREISHISLAVDEACTNIIKHAYKNNKNEKIKIKIKFKNNKLSIKLIDKGYKFDPQIIPEPNVAESQKNKKGGGLGMFLMKKLMDEVKYKSNGKSNELTLIKYVA
jgi:serine/threonine-protein kinase RsbW